MFLLFGHALFKAVALAIHDQNEHGYKNICTFMEKVIPCLGRVFLRGTALIALVLPQTQPSRLKPHFCLCLDCAPD